MAAQPLKRKLIAELERRALEMGVEREEEVTVFDYIYDWVSSGQTMKDLTLALGKAVGHNLAASSGILTSWVNSTPDGQEMLRRARANAAHLLAEEAGEIIDNAEDSKLGLLRARLRVDQNRWLAGKWNRKDYGETPAQVAINFDVGQLHIDAMRQRRIEEGDSTPTLALPAAEGADYEMVETPAHMVVTDRTGDHIVPEPGIEGASALAPHARVPLGAPEQDPN